MTPKRLNVGVVGLGGMGSIHATNFFRLVPRANLVAVCTIMPHEQKWAEEHFVPHGVKLYKTFEEFVEDPDLEAVVVVSLSSMHVQHTLAALKRGLHVLCEKPIAKTSADAKKVSQFYSGPENKATLMCAFMRRFDDDYRDAYNKVQAGLVGQPVLFRSYQVDTYSQDDQVYYEYIRNCGGIFVDSVVHDIDLSLMFLGDDCVPKSVTGIGTAAVFTDLRKNGDADNALGIVEYWGGKMAHFYNSRTATHGYDNESQVYGLGGKVSINALPRRNRVELSNGNGIQVDTNQTWATRYTGGFLNEANAWVEAVLDGKPMPICRTERLRSP